MKIKFQSYRVNDNEDFIILSLSYGKVIYFGIHRGFYLGMTLLNFYIGLIYYY